MAKNRALNTEAIVHQINSHIWFLNTWLSVLQGKMCFVILKLCSKEVFVRIWYCIVSSCMEEPLGGSKLTRGMVVALQTLTEQQFYIIG